MTPRDDIEANPFAAPETDLVADVQLQLVDEFVYAGFGARFVAAFLDYIIVTVVNSVVIIGASLAITAAELPEQVSIFAMLLGYVVQWLYCALQESSEAQATLGKRAMRIKVVDLDGQRISFGRATGRHFARYISGIMCAIGFLIQPFTEKKQTLHDIIASTLVIKD